MTAPDRYPHVEIRAAHELDAWLHEHHAQDEGVWLVTYKKAAGAHHLAHDDVLDLLVAYGWVDGIRRRLDEKRTMQLITPRRTAVWAKSYRDRAQRLQREGAMRPAGQATVDRAVAAGTWDGLPDVEALLIPDDLMAELERRPPARERFEAFAPSTRRNILRWIASAKRPETRQGRIVRTAELASRGEAVKSNG